MKLQPYIFFLYITDKKETFLKDGSRIPKKFTAGCHSLPHTVSHRCKNIFIGQIIIMTFFFEDRSYCVALADLELVM